MSTLSALRIPFAALAAAVRVVTAAARPAATDRFHTRLVKSVPTKDSVLATSPVSIRLWFSEPIELRVSKIRLESSAALAVALGSLRQDASTTDAPMTAAITQPLVAGTYTVYWTAASRHGDAAKGSYAFQVSGRR